MPTLLGVGSELWIELEHSVQADADASAAAHPQTDRGVEGTSLGVAATSAVQRRRPKTLREDQPRLAEAYQREAQRILAREAAGWSLAAEPLRKTRMEKQTASSCAFKDHTPELAAE